MEYLTGLLFALAVAAFAGSLGFDRDRSFAPTILIVIAFYYVLFAMMGASWRTVAIESVFAAAFSIVAAIGARKSPMLVAGAIIVHGLFDVTLHPFIDNPGMPRWWPGFCMAIDVGLGAWLVFRLMRRPSSSS